MYFNYFSVPPAFYPVWFSLSCNWPPQQKIRVFLNLFRFTEYRLCSPFLILKSAEPFYISL